MLKIGGTPMKEEKENIKMAYKDSGVNRGGGGITTGGGGGRSASTSGLPGSGSNVEKAISELFDIESKIKKYGPAMTAVESAELVNRRAELRRINVDVVAEKSINRLFQSAENVARSRRTLECKRKAEINSWDSANLHAEMGVTSVLMDMFAVNVNPANGNSVYDRAKRFWGEVKSSENKYKVRAFHDLLDGLVAKTSNPDDSRLVNSLKVEAASMLNSIRFDSMADDEQNLRDTFDEFKIVFKDFRNMSLLFGENDPYHPLAHSTFSIALRRLQFGTADDGLPFVEVLDPDDERVLGYVKKPLGKIKTLAPK